MYRPGLAIPLLLVASAPSAFAAQSGPYLDTVESIYPKSAPAGFAVSPDGQFLYSSEGGEIVTLSVAPGGVDMHDPIAANIVGTREGARVVRMKIDHDPTDDPEDLMFCAAGRSGLWVMSLNASGEAELACRVDDSADLNPSTQDSRRWCSDVAIMEVDDGETVEEYLVAVSQEKDDNQLRLYELSRARAVWDPASETGNEIAPDVEVRFDGPNARNPNGGSAAPDDVALAYSIAVEESSGPYTYVYVALGMQGVARVRFDDTDVTSGPVVEWGPVFGDGTVYAQTPFQGLLADFKVGDPPLQRSSPPQFVDLTFHELQGNRYLYVAADHAGFVRFDLDASSWGGAMTQNLVTFDGSSDVTQNPFGSMQWTPPLRPPGSAQPASQYVYGHRIETIEVGTRSILAVSFLGQSILRGLNYTLEGFDTDHLAEVFLGVLLGDWNLVRGPSGYTLLYDIDQGFTSPAAVETAGGQAMAVQEHPVYADQVVVFAGNSRKLLRRSVFSLNAVSPPAAMPLPIALDRLGTDRPGKQCHVVGSSMLDGSVLLFGANDYVVDNDGFVVECSGSYDTYQQGDDDRRAANGILFNPRCQWQRQLPEAHGPTQHYVFGIAPGEGTWRVSEYDVGDPCGAMTPPERTGVWKLTMPPDDLFEPGRWFGFGLVDEAYDAHLESLHPNVAPVLFATMDATRDGLRIYSRAVLEELCTETADVGDDLVDGTPIELQDADEWVRLRSHQEFRNIPPVQDTDGDGLLEDEDNYQFLREHGLHQRTVTGIPELFTVDDGGETRWILALPCGTLAAPPDLPPVWFSDDTGDYPTWRPDPDYADHHDHLYVQFWDVTDPVADNLNAQSLPLAEIIGPSPGTGSFQIFVEEVDGSLYAILNNRTGSVLVYDVSNVLTGSVTLVDEWASPESLRDGYGSSVISIDVDHFEDAGEEHVIVYAAAWRAGMAILRFDPGATEPLEEVDLLQVPGNVIWAQIRNFGGEKRLLVHDNVGGVRIYKDDPGQ